MLDLGKISVCGDKTETRIFEEFWRFEGQKIGIV